MSKAYIDAESMIADDFWPADWQAAFAEYETTVTVQADPATHTDAAPFCDRPECACHHDDARFDKYIQDPYRAGLLTLWEAQALLWPER